MNSGIRIKKLHPDAFTPEYATENAAGFDLQVVNEAVIFPGEVMMISTGLAFEIPHWFEMQIRPRSGLSLKYPNYLCNAPGTIDADYRGEIKLLVVNNTGRSMFISKGMRLAQAVISPVVHVDRFTVVDELSVTDRGAGGMGSTGV